MQAKLSSRGFFLGAGAVGSKTWLRRRDGALDTFRNGKVIIVIVTVIVFTVFDWSSAEGSGENQ